jgi:hypothetical protein
LFYGIIRDRVALRLMRRGWSRDNARLAADSLSDETIRSVAKHEGVSTTFNGGILDWLRNHGPQLLKLVEALVAILAMFGDEK